MAEWIKESGAVPRLAGIPVLTQLFTLPEPWYAWQVTADGVVCRALPERPVFGCFARMQRLQEVHFQGTAEQWAGVQKGEDWNAGSGFAVVLTDE